jgi:hypothetical protein
MSRWPRCCPRVAVIALGRPPYRARGGRDLLTRRCPYWCPGPFETVRDLGRVLSAVRVCPHNREVVRPGGSYSRLDAWHLVALVLVVVTARTVQGMARVRSGQAPAWPLSTDRSARRSPGSVRDFACTFTRNFPPVLIGLRSKLRLMLEGWTRTLSGPSQDLAQDLRVLVFCSMVPVRPSWPGGTVISPDIKPVTGGLS